jgi:hypothetical protein
MLAVVWLKVKLLWVMEIEEEVLDVKLAWVIADVREKKERGGMQRAGLYIDNHSRRLALALLGQGKTQALEGRAHCIRKCTPLTVNLPKTGRHSQPGSGLCFGACTGTDAVPTGQARLAMGHVQAFDQGTAGRWTKENQQTVTCAASRLGCRLQRR